MATLLPVVALLLIVFGSAFLPGPHLRRSWPIGNVVALLLIAGVVSVAIFKFAPESERIALLEGWLLGLLPALIPTLIPRVNGQFGAFALGALAPAAALFLPSDSIRTAMPCLIAAAGFAALLLGEESATVASLAAAAVAGVVEIGTYSGSASPYLHSGIVVALGISVIGAGVATLGKSRSFDRFAPAVVGALAVALAYGIGARYLGLSVAFQSMGLAVATALAVHFLFPLGARSDTLRFAIASVLWISLATLSFVLCRAYGMALALLIAVGMLVALGNRRALLTLGPLVGLVMYRVFRQSHLDAVRALDIGQHYALVGLAIGATLPLVAQEWQERVTDQNWRAPVGRTVWCVLLLALPAIVTVLIGPKGIVGFVVGLGFTTFLSAARDEVDLKGLTTAAALGAVATITYGWMQDVSDLARDDKVRWLAWCFLGFIVAGTILALLLPRQSSGAVAGEPL